MDCAPLLLSMLLNPTGSCFSYLACFQPMAAELTIFRNGCKACKRLPLHVLTSQKKIGSIFCGGKRTCFDTPRHRMFFSAPQRRHFCRSKALEAPFFGARRLGFGCEARCFFLKLASCIMVFGGAWHAKSPIGGTRGTE